MSDEKVNILVLAGVEGPSLYINDYRVAGVKPWGGGNIIAEWFVDGVDFDESLGVVQSRRKLEGSGTTDEKR